MSRIEPSHFAVADRPARARGFTLVEVLVSVAIIAVLLGLLFPALNSVRQQARTAECLSNTGQIVRAWHAYVADHGVFPHNDEIIPNASGRVDLTYHRFGWGGTDWYDDELRATADAGTHYASPVRERPLNDYLGLPPHHHDGGGVTYCPADTQLMVQEFDTGTFQPGDIVPYDLSNQSYRFRMSKSPDARKTAHSIHGTSYIANEWMWVSPAAPWGYRSDIQRSVELWSTTSNGPEDIADAGRFVVIGDFGIMNALRIARVNHQADIATYRTTPHQYRHGAERTSAGFLDGSARLLHMPRDVRDGSQDDFTFFPDEQKVANLQAAYPDWSFNGIGYQANIPAPIAEHYGLGR